ncbi:MAG: NusG domain II-containing protein [Clostridia bacterium]|nr:NusG domain II-containing protein [Clostridia bacterium]
MNIKLFKKGDLAVIAVVLAAAGIFALWQSFSREELTAVVTVGGEIIETVDLMKEENRVIIPDTDPKVEIAVENGKIYFKSAECADKLCVSCGKLEKKGDTAVCLPAKTVVTVIGSDVDAVTY